MQLHHPWRLSNRLKPLSVDPGDDLPRILALLAKHRLTVKQILVTHAHIDHIAGAQQLQRLTGAAILYNRRDLPRSRNDGRAGGVAGHGGSGGVGARCGPDRRTPGACGRYRRCHVAYAWAYAGKPYALYFPSESLLLSGDTLFAGSVGRSDLPGGDGVALIRSIHERLLVLPDPTLVIPGHGETTSIERERERNPFLQSL